MTVYEIPAQTSETLPYIAHHRFRSGSLNAYTLIFCLKISFFIFGLNPTTVLIARISKIN